MKRSPAICSPIICLYFELHKPNINSVQMWWKIRKAFEKGFKICPHCFILIELKLPFLTRFVRKKLWETFPYVCQVHHNQTTMDWDKAKSCHTGRCFEEFGEDLNWDYVCWLKLRNVFYAHPISARYFERFSAFNFEKFKHYKNKLYQNSII